MKFHVLALSSSLQPTLLYRTVFGVPTVKKYCQKSDDKAYQ